MIRYYCDDSGHYAGAFEGGHGRDLSHLVEVPAPPEHGLDIWNAAAGVWERAPEVREQAIKQECSTIILDRINEKDQRNLTALGLRHLKRERGGQVLSPENEAQLNMIDDIFDWVQAMKEESRRAIRDGDDPVWPDWDDAWNTLVKLV